MNATLAHLDDAAVLGKSGRLALQGHRLRERSKQTNNEQRRQMLIHMEQAYLAQGLAVCHRLHGSMLTAEELEQESEDHVKKAVAYAG